MPHPMLDHFTCLRKVLEVPLQKLRFAVVSINDLPFDQRFPIVRVFLQGVSPGEVVVESRVSLGAMLNSMQVGLLTLRNLRINKED